ncbi:transposase family protein [Streptomyces glaucescens]|uniref:transposase family protein n=1 Tax=Streptomyces glaucescens TaxID=1907 RepID=UPI001FEB99E1|nr:transposase family protein [Streptomyces glaucescens]
MLEKLGPLDAVRIADLGSYLESVPGPRSRRGRWYSLTAILWMCACAAVCGAESIDELAEFGERATNSLLASLGVRRHLLGWRRCPKPVTLGRVLQARDGDALDQAVGAYLADRTASPRPRTCPRPDRGRSSPWTARLSRAQPAWPRRGATCLSAVTHDCVATIAQVEVGAKTNEVRHFKFLLAPLDLADTVVTFDALHSVKGNITWLVETKKAHCIAVIKTNQPTAYAQLAALPWTSIKVQHTASATAHGRRESRSIKTCAIADNLGGIAFPHAHLAIWVHRRRKPTGRPETRARSPASPPIKPAHRPRRRHPRALGESRILPSPSEMSRSLRTPRPFTPALHPAPWPPSATSPSAP